MDNSDFLTIGFPQFVAEFLAPICSDMFQLPAGLPLGHDVLKASRVISAFLSAR